MRKYSNPEPLLRVKPLKSSYFQDDFREINAGVMYWEKAC